MKRILTTTLIAALSLSAAVTARAQTRRRKAPPPPPKEMAVIAPAQVSIDSGRLEDDTYSNDFFGFSFSVKQGWVALDAATRKVVMEAGREVMQEGVAPKKKAQLDAAMGRTDILISVSKYDVNTPRPEFNAMMMCMAERVPTAVIKTGRDYVAAALRALNETAAKAELVGRARDVTLGGTPFTVADVKLTVGPRVIAQRYYVRLMKGYALAFSYTYLDEEDLGALDEMLKTVRFK
jgi:hypothetical protein